MGANISFISKIAWLFVRRGFFKLTVKESKESLYLKNCIDDSR